MAQLNTYINSLGDVVPIPARPATPHDPNGISRITPVYSRDPAKLAYKDWVDGYKGTSEETLFSNILDGDDVSWAASTYLTFTDGTTDGYIWFAHDGVGVDPEPGVLTLLGKVNVNDADTGAMIAEKLYKVLRVLVYTDATYLHGSTQVAVRNIIPGNPTDASAGTTGGVISVTIPEAGIAPVTTPWDGQYTDTDGSQNLNYP